MLIIKVVGYLSRKFISCLYNDYDFCILGGDYSFGYNDNHGLACERMRTITEFLGRKSRVFGVLGNHDKYKIGQLLNECGVEILV